MTLTQQTISQLRDTARAHGITTGLFGTSKQALVVKINLAQRAAPAATTHIKADTCTESGAHRFIAEASELGWKPGHWPERASTSLGNGQDFILDTVTAGGTHLYKQANGCITLAVLND